MSMYYDHLRVPIQKRADYKPPTVVKYRQDLSAIFFLPPQPPLFWQSFLIVPTSLVLVQYHFFQNAPPNHNDAHVRQLQKINIPHLFCQR